jgi:hypothetical protein
MMRPRKPKLSPRTADYVQFFTIDDLRRDWRAISGGADARTTLRDDVTITRAELEAEIRWRVWWEQVGHGVLLFGAVAAVIAAGAGVIAAWEGSTAPSPYPSATVVTQSTSIVPVLALVVTVLVALVAPLTTWLVAQRQIGVTAREAWMREFREQLAALLSIMAVHRDHMRTHSSEDPEKVKRLAEINDAMLPHWHTLRLLIAEKGPQYAEFMPTFECAMNAPVMAAAARVHELYTAAEDILRRERAAIAADPGLWRMMRNTLGS